MDENSIPLKKPVSFYTAALEAFDEPNYLMELMAKRFDAHSAVFWKRHRHTQDEFEAEGIFNRPALESMKQDHRAYFVLGEENVIFREDTKDDKVITGRAGKPPFDKKWLEKDYTKDLVALGIKYVASCPIATEKGTPFGAVSLYFDQEVELGDTFKSAFSDRCEFLYAMFTLLGGQYHRFITDQSKLIHEILSQAESLTTTLKRIRKAAPHLGASTVDGLDILGDASKAIRLIKSLANARRFQIALANGKHNATFTDIWDAFNSIMQPRIRSTKKDAVALQSIRSNTDDKLFVRLAPSHLNNILANLCDNAIKYCKPGGYITPSLTVLEDGTLRFAISNPSKGIPEKERDLIWQPHFRGRLERSSSVEGQGLGLNIVADICRLYHANYGYTEKDSNNATLRVSTFWIEFPSNIVRRVDRYKY